MRIVVLTGMPASGKSRLARAIQSEFGFPILSKDSFKEALFDTLGFSSYAEKRHLDDVARAELSVALSGLLKAGVSVIIDNNFTPEEGAALLETAASYRADVRVIELTGDPQLLYKRYVRRDAAAKRHIGHALQDHYPLKEGESFSFSMDYEGFCRRFLDRGMDKADWAPLRYRLETSEKAPDYEAVLNWLKQEAAVPAAEAAAGKAPAASRGEAPVVAFPFRSFPELVEEETVAALEAAGFRVLVNRSGKRLDEAAMKAMLAEAFAVVAGSERYGEALLAGAGKLKIIVRLGVGTDNIDLKAAKALGIRVGVIANDYAVAEHALMLMLSLLREQPKRERELRDGIWDHRLAAELRGKTVGLFGFGRIGKRLAGLLQGFEVKLLASDPYFDEAAGRRFGVRRVDADTLLAQSDILSLHLPGTAENAGIIGEEALRKMKPGARLINTARGILVDEEALCRALSDGRLAGAALDAFPKEPPAADSPLFTAPNLILTPHMAALTAETNRAACRTAVRSILSVWNGGEPEYPVRL